MLPKDFMMRSEIAYNSMGIEKKTNKKQLETENIPTAVQSALVKQKYQ